MSLDVGDTIPEFTLPTDGGGSLSSVDVLGKKSVFYFYPKDNTSGCTKEAQAFRDALGDFQAAETAIFGVSPDSVSSHDKFKTKQALNFTLVSDEDKSLSEAFGVWVEKSMYGRKYMGVERSTFLIDEKGVIRQAWRKVKVAGHVEQVLEAAKGI
jgi:peroxiredoxin Q/BCP